MLSCHLRPTLIKRLMDFSRSLGCCGYPVNRVKHIEGTHLCDFNSDKKVLIHTPQEKQATGHCLEVALDLHAGVHSDM